MRRLFAALAAVIVALSCAIPARAQYYDRKNRFEVGLTFPAVLFGNKNIDAMLSGAAEGQYYILNNLSAGLRLENATDFGAGGSPHNIFSFTAIARYTFDVDDSWAVYLGLGGGGALIGSSSWAGDIIPANVGGYYSFNDNLSFGVDAGIHLFIRSNTAFAFWLGPVVRWRF